LVDDKVNGKHSKCDFREGVVSFIIIIIVIIIIYLLTLFAICSANVLPDGLAKSA
jgi:hypothetical protein